MTDLPKPSIIQISQWELEYYRIRMPGMTKEKYINKRKRDWYRFHYYNNKGTN